MPKQTMGKKKDPFDVVTASDDVEKPTASRRMARLHLFTGGRTATNDIENHNNISNTSITSNTSIGIENNNLNTRMMIATSEDRYHIDDDDDTWAPGAVRVGGHQNHQEAGTIVVGDDIDGGDVIGDDEQGTTSTPLVVAELAPRPSQAIAVVVEQPASDDNIKEPTTSSTQSSKLYNFLKILRWAFPTILLIVILVVILSLFAGGNNGVGDGTTAADSAENGSNSGGSSSSTVNTIPPPNDTTATTTPITNSNDTDYLIPIPPDISLSMPLRQDILDVLMENNAIDYTSESDNTPSFPLLWSNPESPQFKAVNFLSTIDEYIFKLIPTNPNDAEELALVEENTRHLLQRYAFCVLYYSTTSGNYNDNASSNIGNDDNDNNNSNGSNAAGGGNINNSDWNDVRMIQPMEHICAWNNDFFDFTPFGVHCDDLTNNKDVTSIRLGIYVSWLGLLVVGSLILVAVPLPDLLRSISTLLIPTP